MYRPRRRAVAPSTPYHLRDRCSGVLNGRLVIEKIPPEEQQVLLQFQAERRVEVVTTRFPLYKITFPAAA